MRRLRRFLRFFFVGLIPALLILGLAVGVLWSGFRVAAAMTDRLSAMSRLNERAAAYVQTATAIAPTIMTHTATSTQTPNATATPPPTSTSTATATPQPTLTPTPLPPSATPTPQVIVQFTTNTPLPPTLALPPTNTPAALISVTPAPTFTPTATLAPSATPTTAATARALPTLLIPENPDPAQVDVTAIPTAVEFIPREYALVNIILLGTDAEITNDGSLRTDTMIIVSINLDTGTVAMLSLPRDLFVYIPALGMQRLNVAYGYGEAVGWTDGGFGLLRQTILYNFGINVHYYALVNLSGFETIIDAVGGVDLAVDCAIQDYQLIGAQMPAGAVQANDEGLWTLPVGYYRMSGAEALWYARSRHNSLEFDRGRRQQQLLRAILRSARDQGLLTQVPTLWNETMSVVETNLQLDDIIGLLPIAVNLESSAIENFRFIRLYHTTPWTTPDGSNVQLPIFDTVRELMIDFYTPPTQSQVSVERATIAVYNGTTNTDWDRVAAERLNWEGFSAVAMGAAQTSSYTDTVLIDYTGQEKGSSLEAIALLLNIRPENVLIEPDPNRSSDFAVIVGSSYNSCTEQGVLAVDEGTPAP
ncbi:MAG: LCP family protein [Chloroflexi bacterium]|nr:LCP family protein [Chloroflexota bacterium]